METRHFQSRIDSLEKQNVNEYNLGMSFYYDCIMFMLKMEYLELDMSKLKAGVNTYMDEQNKESGETYPPHRTTTNATAPQAIADSAPSVVEKSHGAEADPLAKAPNLF